MRILKELLRKTVSVLVVTFLFLQFFTVSPLISEGNENTGSDNTQTTENNTNNTSDTDPSDGDFNDGNENENNDDVDPNDNNNPSDTGDNNDDVDPNEGNDQGDNNDPADNNQNDDINQNEENNDYPAFYESQIIDDEVKITVVAEENVFPAGAVLYVEKVENIQELDEALDEVRSEHTKVAVSYTYDIKVLDEEGNEIQPLDGSKVRISFVAVHVANDNLMTNVYHINETNPEDITADNVEVLDVATNGEEAIVETESFSLYTVEFTYNNLQYVLDGNSSVLLSEILNYLGLLGEVENIEISNRELFDVIKNDDNEYVLISKKAFSSEEWMKITIDGIVYEIIVTDVAKKLANFVSESKFAEYHIDRSKLTYSNATVTIDDGSKLKYDITNRRIETTAPDNYYQKGKSKEMGGVRVVYEDAAIDSEGKPHALEFYFKNIIIYQLNKDRGTNKVYYVLSLAGIPTIAFGQPAGTEVSDETVSNFRTNAAMSLDLEMSVLETSGDVSFFVSFNDFNTNRSKTWANVDVHYGDSYNSFNESVKINTSEDVYYADDRALNPTYMREGWYVPGYNAASISGDDDRSGSKSEVVYRNTTSKAEASFRTQIMNTVYGNSFSIINLLSYTEIHTITVESGPFGKYEIWNDGQIDGDKKLYEGKDSRTYDVPNGKEVTIKFTPEDGYLLKVLQMNGGQVSAVPRDEHGRVVPAKDAVYYTYTMPASHTTDAVFYVEWTKPNVNCIDCKNFEACENCYFALAGSDLNGYTNYLERYHPQQTRGVYRGTSTSENAATAIEVGNYLDDEKSPRDNTFAKSLPYGTIYIDPSQLVWDNDHVPNIEFKDNRFVLVGTGKTSATGSTAYPDAVGSVTEKAKYSDLVYNLDIVRLSDAEDGRMAFVSPTIAYYGPVHSYLRYGSEADNHLGYYPRDNTPAIDANVATGTYSAKDKDNQTRTVNVIDGTNVIEAPAGSYLYKIRYKNAAILQDGSRGDLEVFATRVEIESSVSSGYGATIDTREADCAVVGLQKANQMQINGGFAHVGLASDTDISDQDKKNAVKNFIGRDEPNGSTTIRNGIGARTDISFQVVRSDGTPVEGIIAYAVNDLDITSYESLWGRKPEDRYVEDHSGTIATTDPDYEAKNAWTHTYEFNRFAESMTINEGALSYALLPYYNHFKADPDTWTGGNQEGNLPINRLMKTFREMGAELTGYDRFEAPLKVVPTGAQVYGKTANGYTFATSNTYKGRNSLGVFQNPWVDPTSSGYQYESNDVFRANRGDGETYDTGFAVLLNAVGTKLTWAGSNHTNDAINTTLFDTKFVQYLRISHGTGGGIYVEDYHVTNDCEPEYRENMVALPYGSSVKTTIVPEDGYRVNKITVDDIKIEIEYDDDGNPIKANFIYGNGDIDPVKFINGTAIPDHVINAQYESGTPLSTYRLAITANDDGIFDVEMWDRNYVEENGAYVSPRHNIHADFDTFYYFTKVWADAGSHPEDLPTTLTFTASPYVLDHDKVVVDSVEYDITETRTMHMDVIDDSGSKYDSDNKHYPQYDLHTSLDDGALLLMIGGQTQVYPTFTIRDLTPEEKYVVIGDDCYKVVTNTSGQEEPDWPNPYQIIRSEDGYEVNLPGTPTGVPESTKHPGFTTYVLHHVKEFTFVGTNGNTYTTTDNPDRKSDGTYSDIVYVVIGTRIQKPYSLIKLHDGHYVITGNKLHKVVRNANGVWEVDTSFTPETVTSKFERYNDGTYINKKNFTIDTTDPEQSKYISQSYINDGQDLVWKIKYPAKGKAFTSGEEWPELAIETEHIYDDMHEINADHVNRLYWFVNERLGTLTGKWALDGYTNDNTAIKDTYRSNSEAPGYMSYRDYLGNIKYNTTYFYLLATEDHEEALKELGDMAELRMAFLSPISSETIRRSSYAGTYGPTYYTEWGGMVVNSIHQTKLQVKKNWIGGELDEQGRVVDGDRIPFKMTINRKYNYRQISHLEAIAPVQKEEIETWEFNGVKYDVQQDAIDAAHNAVVPDPIDPSKWIYKDITYDTLEEAYAVAESDIIYHEEKHAVYMKVVTLPYGEHFRDILYRLAGKNADKVKRFRNGTEPLTSNKNAAIVLEDGGNGRVANLDEINPKKLVKIPYNTFNYFGDLQQPESVEASVYLWFDAADDGTIYMWTDAEHVFMAEDASYMFYGFNNLEQISGVHILNTSQTKYMTSMFEATTSGKITNLYNVREWDTSKVENFDNFLKNQDSLNHIHGLIDWNLSSGNSFINFIGKNDPSMTYGETQGEGKYKDYDAKQYKWTDANDENTIYIYENEKWKKFINNVEDTTFDGNVPYTAKHIGLSDWSRYINNDEKTKTHLFIWYPNVYIDENGNVVTPDGQPLTKAHSQTSDGTARDLHWDSEDLSNMGTWWNNGINTPTNFNDNSPYTTWEWDIQEDNMAYSDADKWSYRLYENDYGKDYVNSDFALDILNAKDFVYNELTGKWEATLTNVKTTSVNIQKKTIDNENGEFKFRVKFESIYEPEDIVEKPTENTIVVTKRFVDDKGVFLDLSENPNDYAYIVDEENKKLEYKLILYSNGAGDDPSGYTNPPIYSKVFPEGWTKNSNGTWSYVFENIDDKTIGYLVAESSDVQFRYQGATEISTFTPIISSVAKISQEKNTSKYHSASFENETTVGNKSDIQRAQAEDLKEHIQVEYKKGNGLKKVTYEVWDGQQYEIYDVILGVDKDGNIRKNEDGSIQDFAVYYGGVENGVQVALDAYPYYIYTDDEEGDYEYTDVLNHATYDPETNTTVFIGSRGLHTFDKHFHILKVVEKVDAKEMTYGRAKEFPKLPIKSYIFKDPVDTKIEYKFDGTAWKKYNNGAVDPSWTGNVPPDETIGIINKNKMTEIWGTKYPNERKTRRVIEDPNYQTSGSYKVTNPATGIAEEYYIIEQLGTVVSATHKKTDESGTTETTIENIISSIGFNAKTGEANFETSDGREYHFSNSEIVVVPNVWEFTLRNEEDFTLRKVPLGTTYEVWEYDLSGEWTLINREEKRVTLKPDGTVDPESEQPVTPSTASQYVGGDNLETIQRYSYIFKEDPTVSDPDTYYQYKTGKIVNESEYVADRYYEYETYSNDVSILKVYRKLGEVYVEDNNASPKYYKQIYTKTRPTDTTAELYVGYDGSDPNSCTKYKLDYYEASNGTFYKLKEGDPQYINEMPIDQSHNTSTGNGGVRRFVGNTDVVRHIFTNEKDTFSLTIDKTVKGNQGSKDQYFKFIVEIDNLNKDNLILTINDAESVLTTSFRFEIDQENGTYYRLKDGRYTDVPPEPETAHLYVGYKDGDKDSCTKYKAIKPNLATEFLSYIMQNANNRDDNIAQRIQLTFQEVKMNPDMDEKDYTFEEVDSDKKHPNKYMYDIEKDCWMKLIWNAVDDDYDKTSIQEEDIPLNARYVPIPDYLTFEEANNKDLSIIDPKDYVFEITNKTYPDYPTKYIYDTTDDTWVEYTWGYDEDDAGSSYKKVNYDEYIDNEPAKSDVPDYEGYDETWVQDRLDKYDASGQPHKSGTIYYKYVNGGIISYEEYNSDHRMDYENAYELALDKLTTYKPSYHPKDVTEDEIPLDAITLGIAGRQIVAKFDEDEKRGKVSFVIYLKHGESIKVDGFNKGATFKITEIIDGLEDYKTTITDLNGENEILGRVTEGEFGKEAIEDSDGAYYKLNNENKYEKPNEYYADFLETNDLDSLPKYKIVYSERASGEYYLIGGEYVDIAPSSDRHAWEYDDYDHAKATENIKKYSIVKEDPDGEYFKLIDGGYTKEEPTSDGSAVNYVGYSLEQSIEDVKKYSITYTASDDGTYYKLNDGSYTEVAPTIDTATAYDGYSLAKVTENVKKYNITYTASDDGTYYKLNDGSYTEVAPTIDTATAYDGYSLAKVTENVKKYNITYTASDDGTYYKLNDGSYTEVAPNKDNASSYDGYSYDIILKGLTKYSKKDNKYVKDINGKYYHNLTDGRYTVFTPQEKYAYRFEGYSLDIFDKYTRSIVEDPSGSYYELNDGTYTTDVPTDSTAHNYVGYSLDIFDKYTRNIVEDPSGSYYELNDGTYTTDVPTDSTAHNYVGYSLDIFDKYTRNIVEDPSGSYYELNDGTYTTDVPTDSTAHNYVGYKVNYIKTKYKLQIEESDDGRIYKLKDGSYTTVPYNEANAYQYDGYSIDHIRKFRQDFVRDDNGTFYKTYEGYTETTPNERYDRTRKYTLNIGRKYINTKDGIVPTKAFAGYFMPLIILNFIALCYVLYDRKRNKDRLADE